MFHPHLHFAEVGMLLDSLFVLMQFTKFHKHSMLKTKMIVKDFYLKIHAIQGGMFLALLNAHA